MPSFWQRLGLRAPAHEAKTAFSGAQAFMVPAGQAVWMRRDYSKFADEGFRRNVIAYRAISMVASGAAQVAWRVEQRKGKRVSFVENHPLLALLKRPNPTQGGSELFEMLYTHRMISGNAFVHAIGPKGEPPLELYALRPDRVSIIPGAGGVPKAYRYTVGNRNVDMPVDAVIWSGRACCN